MFGLGERAHRVQTCRGFEQYGFVVLILVIVVAPRFITGLVGGLASILLGFNPFPS